MAKETILDTFNWKGSKERRKMAADKLELYQGRHIAKVRARIRELHNDPQAAATVAKYASLTPNLCRQFTELVAIAYNRGCVRDVSTSSPVATAFADIVAESGMPEAQTTVNAYAWLLGPTFVIPQVEPDGTFWVDIISPDRSAVILKNPREPKALLYQRDDGLFVLLDEQGWSYFDSEGEPMRGLAPIVHGLGYCPAAIFRGKHWAGDWWNQWEHRALVDATLNVAAFDALQSYKLKNSGKQLVITAELESMASGQVIAHPELPLHFNTRPEGARVDAVDLSQPIGDFKDKIAQQIIQVCELYGIPPSALSGVNSNVDWGQVGMARAPEVLDALRDKQVPHMRNGELQLWPMICDLLRASTHRHARALPPGDEVADMMRVRFLEPTPDVDRRKKRLELFETEEKLGLSSAADLLMEQHPALTREQAAQWIADNLDRYFERISNLASRNIPATQGDAIESVAQAQGRLGGLTKAAQQEQVTDNG